MNIRVSKFLADGDGGLVVDGENYLTLHLNAPRIAQCISSIRERAGFSSRGLDDPVLDGLGGGVAIQDVVCDLQCRWMHAGMRWGRLWLKLL